MSQRTNFVYLEGQLFRYEERNAAGKTVSILTLRLPGPTKGKDSAFIPVEVWELESDLRKQLNDGAGKARVLVQGEIRQDSWTDKATGGKRSKLKISARRVSYEGLWRDENVEGSSEASKDNRAPLKTVIKNPVQSSEESVPF